MSKTLPSGSVKVVHRVPYSSNSATLVAPRATARSTSAERSVAARSRCSRFLPWRGSGTPRKHQRGKGAVFRGWDQGEELVGAVGDRAVEQGGPEGGDLVSALGIDDNLAKSKSHGGVPSS